jgi:hypothetical protein
MEHALIYHAVKQKFIACRRASHEGKMTPDEAGEEYAKFGDELAETYGHELAEQAMNDFTSDLKTLDWMEKVDHLGLIARVIGYVSGFLVSDTKATRVINLNDEMLRLDAEYIEPKPGDTQ